MHKASLCGPRCNSGDGGFTLVEVMAAMVVFLIVAGAALSLIIGALHTIRESGDRVAAATIARSEAESLRARGAYSIPLGESSRTLVTTQGTYSVSTTANWVGVGQLTNACQVGGGLVPGKSYVRVHVEVTSEKLARPQTTDTLVYPLDPLPNINNTGTATTQVVDALGLPVPGVSVTGSDLAGNSPPFGYVTGADGCVFIPDVPASSQWQVQISKAGYITESLGGTVSTKQVLALANTPFNFAYDQPASIRFSVDDDGFTVPADVPMTLTPDPLVRTPEVVASYPVTVTGLWPRPAGYTAWLGRCSDAATSAASVINAQAGQTAQAVLAGARVQVVAPQGSAITATHSDAQGGTGGCSESYSLGVVGSTLLLKTRLPFGVWSFSQTASSTTILASLEPSTGTCSVQWSIPGAVTASQANQTPAPSPSPSLIYPTVSSPCPAPQ